MNNNQKIAKILGKCICDESYEVRDGFCTKCGRDTYAGNQAKTLEAFQGLYKYYSILQYDGRCAVTGHTGKDDVGTSGSGKDMHEAIINAILNSVE